MGMGARGMWMGRGSLSRNQTLQFLKELPSQNQDMAEGRLVSCSGGPEGSSEPLGAHQHQLNSPCFLSRENTQEFKFPGYYRHPTPSEGGTQQHPEWDVHSPCLDILAQPGFLENITEKVQLPQNRICLPLTGTPFGFSSQKEGAASVLFGIGGINGVGRKAQGFHSP